MIVSIRICIFRHVIVDLKCVYSVYFVIFVVVVCDGVEEPSFLDVPWLVSVAIAMISFAITSDRVEGGRRRAAGFHRGVAGVASSLVDDVTDLARDSFLEACAGVLAIIGFVVGGVGAAIVVAIPAVCPDAAAAAVRLRVWVAVRV